jgi:hypothetical protein
MSDAATLGLRALHYVQDEIRHLSSIKLTPEGDHALLVFRVMLRAVWGKEFRDGEFVFLDQRTTL